VYQPAGWRIRAKSNNQAKYVELAVEDLRTRVRFPAASTINTHNGLHQGRFFLVNLQFADGGGVGGGIVDRLRQLSFDVVEANGFTVLREWCCTTICPRVRGRPVFSCDAGLTGIQVPETSRINARVSLRRIDIVQDYYNAR